MSALRKLSERIFLAECRGWHLEYPFTTGNSADFTENAISAAWTEWSMRIAATVRCREGRYGHALPEMRTHAFGRRASLSRRSGVRRGSVLQAALSVGWPCLRELPQPPVWAFARLQPETLWQLGRPVIDVGRRNPRKHVSCGPECKFKLYLALAKAKRRRPTKVCAICNMEFQPRRADSKYCSALHRHKAYRQAVSTPSWNPPLARQGLEMQNPAPK